MFFSAADRLTLEESFLLPFHFLFPASFKCLQSAFLSAQTKYLIILLSERLDGKSTFHPPSFVNTKPTNSFSNKRILLMPRNDGEERRTFGTAELLCWLRQQARFMRGKRENLGRPSSKHKTHSSQKGGPSRVFRASRWARSRRLITCFVLLTKKSLTCFICFRLQMFILAALFAAHIFALCEHTALSYCSGKTLCLQIKRAGLSSSANLLSAGSIYQLCDVQKGRDKHKKSFMTTIFISFIGLLALSVVIVYFNEKISIDRREAKRREKQISCQIKEEQ